LNYKRQVDNWPKGLRSVLLSLRSCSLKTYGRLVVVLFDEILLGVFVTHGSNAVEIPPPSACSLLK